MSTASTIPYQLRTNKVIERNLFFDLLKRLALHISYDFSSYRYVGFGAPSLEDFKQVHYELGLKDMVSLECLEFPYQRQVFNRPFRFIDIKYLSSSDYINNGLIEQDRNHIFWLDYAVPSDFNKQLLDLELLTKELSEGDVVKYTFNASPLSYKDLLKCPSQEIKPIYEHFGQDSFFVNYTPLLTDTSVLKDNLGGLLRTMGVNAFQNGFAANGKTLVFLPISAFQYKDGQSMTTVCGLIINPENKSGILESSALKKWPFEIEQISIDKPLLNAHKINVPAVTLAERLEIDKLMPEVRIPLIAEQLPFRYVDDTKKNDELIEGYCKYYKYLPYFTKIIY